jgi:peptide/nickel transport system ATP-binding protein
MDETPLLSVRDLRVSFATRKGVVQALGGVTFDIYPREVFGLVGETGCGKSVTALSILRLVPDPGRIVGGEIRFEGANLLKLREAQVRRIRGRMIAMVFQDPMTYLNPVLTVGDQIAESVLLYGTADDGEEDAVRGRRRFRTRASRRKRRARREAARLLRLVGMPQAEDILDRFPHELSGGMRQRAMIAMALARKPKLLIADEPTTALDVLTQARILRALADLKDRFDLSILLITHDLGIVAQFCDRVGIMYAGTIAEIGPRKAVLKRGLHPYTEGLLAALPRVDRQEPLQGIEGSVPDMRNPPSGCRFHPRCPHAMPQCRTEPPPLREERPGQWVACHLYPGEGAEA